MPAETEAVRATTTELPLVPGHMSSPDPTGQKGTGPAGCRARHPKKEKVMCGPPTHHRYIDLDPAARRLAEPISAPTVPLETSQGRSPAGFRDRRRRLAPAELRLQLLDPFFELPLARRVVGHSNGGE